MKSKSLGFDLTKEEQEIFHLLSNGSLVSEICDLRGLSYIQVIFAARKVSERTGRPVHKRHDNLSTAPGFSMLTPYLLEATREVAAGKTVFEITRAWGSNSIGRHIVMACETVKTQSIAGLVEWAVGSGLVPEGEIDPIQIEDHVYEQLFRSSRGQRNAFHRLRRTNSEER